MSAGARLLAFAGLIAAVFAAAAFAGSRLDSDTGDEAGASAAAEAAPAHAGDGGHGAAGEPAEAAATSGEGGHRATGAGGMPAEAAAGLPGLADSEAGYTLELAGAALSRGSTGELAFRISGPGGRTVRDFDIEHTKRMHLILVRSDLSGFQHLHPDTRPDGSWTVRARIAEGGAYRLLADFSVAGVKRTLGANITVDGPFAARPLPAPTRVERAGGYEVRLASGTPRAGRESDLRFEVTRGGRPTAVQPYLGARGHLVALRASDLAYLHVHPDDDELSFAANFPSSGPYRLFLQFRAGGTVHTVAYTVEVTR